MRSWQRGIVFALLAVPLVLMVLLPMGGFLVPLLFRVDGPNIIREPSLDNFGALLRNWSQIRTFLPTLLLCAKVSILAVLMGIPSPISLGVCTSLCGRS